MQWVATGQKLHFAWAKIRFCLPPQLTTVNMVDKGKLEIGLGKPAFLPLPNQTAGSAPVVRKRFQNRNVLQVHESMRRRFWSFRFANNVLFGCLI